MRNDVHGAALRAAAKVAFSVAFIGGCSAAAPDAAEADPVTGNNDNSEPGTTESDLSAKKPKKPKVAPPASTSCHGNPTTPPSCEAVVNAAFPTEGNYPGTKQSVSSEVQACCVELIDKAQGGALTSHRWDCCANLPADAPQSTAIGCTPWGPPVPPRMKRMRSLAEVA
jgi:hypothetical protein